MCIRDIFKIDRGRIKENQIQSAEQILATFKQAFFNTVFIATGRKWSCAPLVRQFCSQKPHGPVEVMQGQRFRSLDSIMLFPLFAGTITATDKQTIQYGKKDGPFHIK
ncbi:MAG: hypothetical protein D4R68_07750 [Ignavibacteriales bacterium]|nr:MAG: hypothetical protein D4R68_07750 [Ignavibacteriales bacterium]